MRVAIFQNLVAQDGRRVIEIRYAQPLGFGYFTNAQGTLYSCAYSNHLGGHVAMARAIQFCKDNLFSIVHIEACEGRRAAWQ